MKKLFATLCILNWGLWFGGTITLFISVSRLFLIDRELGKHAAPQLFHVFARYQLVLAGIALFTTMFWRMGDRSVWHKVRLGLFMLATAGAIVLFYITYQLEVLNAIKGSSIGPPDPQFDHLHAMSKAVYMTVAAVLLIVGCTFPIRVKGDAPVELTDR